MSYKLIRISLMHWNVMDLEDIDIEGTTALIGAVGVGKSTILDAVQTVITGNNKHALRLNRAAGAHSSKRTVKEYCLGVTEETQLDPHAPTSRDTILALTFQRDDVTRHCVSFGLVLHAEADKSREDTVMRWIAPGVDFSFERYASRKDGDLVVDDWQEVMSRVKTDAKGNWETYNQVAKKFVEQYLRSMRRGRAAPDAEQFLQRFANAIAFEEIQEPTAFVRNFVLEVDPIETDGLRMNLETWDNLAQNVAAVQAKLSLGGHLQDRYRRAARAHLKEIVARYRVASTEARHTRLALATARTDLDTLKSQDDRLERRIDDIRRESAVLAEKKEQLDREAHAKGGSAQQLRKVERDATAGKIMTAKGDLLRLLGRAVALTETTSLDDHLPPYVKKARKIVSDRLVPFARALKTDAEPSMTPEDLAEAIAAARDAGRAVDALDAVREHELVEKNKLVDALKELTEALLDKSTRNVSLDPAPRAFIAQLVEQGVTANALPDLVDVREGMEDWALACELALGAWAQAIYVAPKDLDAAFALLRGAKHRFHSVRLINSRKLEGQTKTRAAAERAVVGILETREPLVQRFLEQQFGHVEMVDTPEALRTHNSGIMKDGTQSQGFGIRVHNTQNRYPILGAAAQVAQANRMQADSDTIRTSLQACAQRLSALRSGYDILSGIRKIDPKHAGDIYSSLRSEIRSLAEIEGRMAEDLGDEAKQIEGQIQAVKTKIDELRIEEQKLNGELRDSAATVATLKGNVERLQSKLKLTEGRAATVAKEDQGEPYTTYRRALRDLIDDAANLSIAEERRHEDAAPEITVEACATLLEQRQAELAEAQKLPDHMRLQREFDEFARKHLEIAEIAKVSALKSQEVLLYLNEQLQRLKDHELLKYEAEIEDIGRRTRIEVRTILLTKLHDLFARMKGRLKELNKRLRQHRFGGQTYVWTYSIDPRMRPLLDLTKRVADDPDGADRMLEVGGDPVLDQALEIVREIFSEGGETKQFEDYRQYFTFELKMTNDEVDDAELEALSQGDQRVIPSKVCYSGNLTDRAAKGSGGQKQTPYYVAIAASMAAAYYPGARRDSAEGMGLVCFDEAFSKLDIHSTQELIRFFSDLNLQILVAAPEEKRASFMPLMDTIVNISKDPRQNRLHLQVEQMGPLGRETLQRTNPEWIGLEGYRKILNEEAEQLSLLPHADKAAE